MTEILSSIEAAVTRAEETWDALSDSGIGEVIPAAGHIVKIWRVAHDVRDALFAAKLRAFITDPSLQTPEARATMRERAESEEAKKIGETLLLVIERLNDMQKPIWLSKVYAAYLADEIKASDLRRLMSAIDMAFGDDLIELINSPEALVDDSAAWKKNLTASGLIDALTTAPLNATRRTYFVSEYGRMFRKAVRDHS
jgi:hypothetical protein